MRISECALWRTFFGRRLRVVRCVCAICGMGHAAHTVSNIRLETTSHSNRDGEYVGRFGSDCNCQTHGSHASVDLLSTSTWRNERALVLFISRVLSTVLSTVVDRKITYTERGAEDFITLISPRKLHLSPRSELIAYVHQLILHFLSRLELIKNYMKSCHTFWPVDNYL